MDDDGLGCALRQFTLAVWDRGIAVKTIARKKLLALVEGLIEQHGSFPVPAMAPRDHACSFAVKRRERYPGQQAERALVAAGDGEGEWRLSVEDPGDGRNAAEMLAEIYFPVEKDG